MVKKSEYVIKKEHLRSLDQKYRFEILAKAIEVENWITNLICLHFVDIEYFDELMKFNYCIMEDSMMLNFNNRREILRRIIMVENYMIEKDRKSLDSDIQKISAIRNHIAHKPILNNLEDVFNFDGKTISYYSYKFEKGKSIKELVTIDENKFKIEIDRMDNVISRLRLLETIIEKRDRCSKTK